MLMGQVATEIGSSSAASPYLRGDEHAVVGEVAHERPKMGSAILQGKLHSASLAGFRAPG